MSRSLGVRCVRCGDVDVALDDARLQATPDMADVGVTFVCPLCGTTGSMDVDERGIRLLMAADVELVTASRPDARSGVEPDLSRTAPDQRSRQRRDRMR